MKDWFGKSEPKDPEEDEVIFLFGKERVPANGGRNWFWIRRYKIRHESITHRTVVHELQDETIVSGGHTLPKNYYGA